MELAYLMDHVSVHQLLLENIVNPKLKAYAEVSIVNMVATVNMEYANAHMVIQVCQFYFILDI